MTNAEMAALARSLIEDPDAEYVTHAELDLYLDQTCIDFSRRSHVLRGSASLSYDNTGLVTLPDDVYMVLRLVGADGREICRAEEGDLPYQWETVTGTPYRYFRCLTPANQLRLYPKPTIAGTATLYYVKQHRAGYASEIPVQHHMGLVWGAAAMGLMKSSKPSDEPRMKRYSALYEAEVIEATGDHSANFEADTPDIPYNH